jgi:hypothetical protein
MKKSAEARTAAACLLAREVSAVIMKQLQAKGWTLEKTDPPVLWNDSWDVKTEDVTIARMSVNFGENGVNLYVIANFKIFTHQFKLHNTDSPRKIACLLVQWLKYASVRSVMSA